MQSSSYLSAPLSVLSAVASTSSASTSSLRPETIGSNCHYRNVCSTSTSNNQMTDFSDHPFDQHIFEESCEQNSIGVPNDYFYNSEEQHEFRPKLKTCRQKGHEVRRKHIFKDVAGIGKWDKVFNSGLTTVLCTQANDFSVKRPTLTTWKPCEDYSRKGLTRSRVMSATERHCISPPVRATLRSVGIQSSRAILVSNMRHLSAQLLLEKGADPNQKDAIGNTALHLAVCTNNIEVITLLLSAGTDINSLDNRGRTPLHLAQSKLKMIQSMQRSDVSITSSQLKNEVLQVLQMMSVYWHRSGRSKELELLTAFTNRLHLSQTCEEVSLSWHWKQWLILWCFERLAPMCPIYWTVSRISVCDHSLRRLASVTSLFIESSIARLL